MKAKKIAESESIKRREGMKKNVSLTITIMIILAMGYFSGCVTTAQLGQDQFAPKSEEVMVMSRGVEIPATIVYPMGSEDVKYPLVVMAHGHGGGRQENGGFGLIAERLASAGIVSIRMDFPGCGDSTELWIQNNMTNMLIDIESSRQYALDHYDMINKKQVSIMGYSTGGRLAIHSASMNPGMWKAMGLLAPSAEKGKNAGFLGGQENFKKNMTIAEKDGSYLFTTPWGQEQELGYKFFEDMNTSDPQELIKGYKGPIFAVTGDKDTSVLPETVQALLESAESAASTGLHMVKGANHGYGFYSDEGDISLEVANVLTDFFIENLN